MKLKWILTGLVAIVVAVGVGGYVVLSQLDLEEYREVIQAEAKAATGRDLTIAGPIDLAISLTPAVTVEDVTFANADWGSRPEMVKMKRFELEVALMPLLSGEIQVNRFVLVEPDILIETNAEGAGNWELELGGAPAEGQDEPAAPSEEGGAGLALKSVGEIRIENGQLTYRDGASGAETKVELASLATTIASSSSPLELAIAGAYNGNPFEVDGTLGSLDSLNSGPFPIDLVAKAGGAAVKVAGAVENPQAGTGINLTILAEGESLKDLGPLAGTEVPDLGAYSLAAKVSQGDQIFTISDLIASIAGITAEGGLAVSLAGPAPAPQGVDIKLSAKGDSVMALGQKVGTDLPDLGAYEVAAHLTQEGNLFTVGGLNVAIANSQITGQATLELVDNAPVPKDIDITVNTQGESLADVGKLVGQELPPLGPYVFIARITNEGEAYKLSDLNLKMGGSDLAGEVLVSVAGERPSAKGQFSAQLLDVADFTAEAAEGDGTASSEGGESQDQAESEEQPADGAGGVESPYVFTDDPLPLDGLQAADADLKLTAGTLRLKDGLELTELDLTLGLQNGKLSITPLIATLADGKIQADVGLDGGAATPDLAAKLSVVQLDYGKLLETLEGEAQASGKVDLAVDVRGSGGSLRQLVSGLNGTAQMISEQGTINNRLVKIVAGGLSDIMGPLMGDDDQARLNCLVTNFDIVDGLATSKAVVLDTEVFTVAGAGDIQLKTEALGLTMDTATREASLASLAIPFQVKGTMKSPEVIPDPVGAITGLAGSVGSEVKEVGQIGQLIGQITGKKEGSGGGIGANPCVAALQTVGRDYQGEIYEEPEATEDTQAGEPKSVEDQAKDAVGGVLNKVLGGGDAPAEGAVEPGAEAVTEEPVKDVEEGAKKLLKGLFD